MLIRGLQENGCSVQAISGPQVTSQNCKRKIVCLKSQTKGGIAYRYVTTINLPLIRNLTQFGSALLAVLKQCLREDAIVMCDVLQGSVSYAAMLVCKGLKRPCIGIVTDLPEMLVTGASRQYAGMVARIMRGCTHYVFLTEHMDRVVNPSGKPYVVIEGISDSQAIKGETERAQKSLEKQICLYAGMLEEKYGVKMMVEAFLLAKIPNAELHVYGNGSYAETLKTLADTNVAIIYHGSVLVDAVEEAERRADLLINPRPSEEAFTKYSFPSKNMEYMTSGTPMLMTRLPGIPEAYYQYAYTFDEETVEGMARTMQTVLAIPRAQRNELGKKAQAFVLEQKNEYVQARKVLERLL